VLAQRQHHLQEEELVELEPVAGLLQLFLRGGTMNPLQRLGIADQVVFTPEVGGKTVGITAVQLVENGGDDAPEAAAVQVGAPQALGAGIERDDPPLEFRDILLQVDLLQGGMGEGPAAKLARLAGRGDEIPLFESGLEIAQAVEEDQRHGAGVVGEGQPEDAPPLAAEGLGTGDFADDGNRLAVQHQFVDAGYVGAIQVAAREVVENIVPAREAMIAEHGGFLRPHSLDELDRFIGV